MIKENKYFKSISAKPKLLPLHVVAFSCNDMLKTYNHFAQQNGWSLINDDTYYGLTVTDQNKSYIFLRKDSTLSHLVHEITHAAMDGLAHVGIKYDEDNQEILAYYSQFLFDNLQHIIDAKDTN